MRARNRGFDVVPFSELQLGLVNEPYPSPPTVLVDTTSKLCRSEWLSELERETLRHRIARAEELERRGYRM